MREKGPWRLHWLFSVAVLAVVSPPCLADLIIPGSHTDHPVISGGDLADVRLAVDLTVEQGIATMDFTNVSTGLETSAVIKEIVVQALDGGVALLWSGQVLTDTKDVAFTLGASNGLPGFVPLMAGGELELQAKPSPVKCGLGIGETLQVRFATSLPNGAGIGDYVARFAGGEEALVLGFHAISASTVGGESLSGATVVPEPGTLVLLALGGVGLILRRRRA